MKRYVLLLLLAALVLAGCSGQENTLIGNWKLISYGPEGSPFPAVADSQAEITFGEDGMVSGTSGCNSFGGQYKEEGDQLIFSGLVSTLMACQEPLMSQEGVMLQVLNGSATYEIDGDTLTITNAGMALVFTASNVKSYPNPSYTYP